jgi:ferredoxin
MKEKSGPDLKNMLNDVLLELSGSCKENSLRMESGEKAWGRPILGFVRADDPLFRFFKEDIGGFYWLPEEVFALETGDRGVKAEELTVVSWVFPQTQRTKEDQRAMDSFPAERWSRSRGFWSSFTRSIHQAMISALSERGFTALAPELSSCFSRTDTGKYGYASSWSQRHTAYAAGLGTFGLSDGLITPSGKAVRFGSLVVKAAIACDRRPYDDHHAYCLFYRDGSCTDCIDRCPAGAITERGHDKELCAHYIRTVVEPACSGLGLEDTPGCGLCQCAVACESGIPVKKK